MWSVTCLNQHCLIPKIGTKLQTLIIAITKPSLLREGAFFFVCVGGGGGGLGPQRGGLSVKVSTKGEGHTSCELFKGGSHIFSRIF